VPRLPPAAAPTTAAASEAHGAKPQSRLQQRAATDVPSSHFKASHPWSCLEFEGDDGSQGVPKAWYRSASAAGYPLPSALLQPGCATLLPAGCPDGVTSIAALPLGPHQAEVGCLHGLASVTALLPCICQGASQPIPKLPAARWLGRPADALP
jgi:hypothetical protein